MPTTIARAKARLGKSAPKWVVRGYRRLAIAFEFYRDYTDYATATAWDHGAGRPNRRRDDAEALFSRVTIAYHGLEKGATFPAPKRPFGKSKIEEIRRLSLVAKDPSPTLIENAATAASAVEKYNDAGTISDFVTPISTDPIVPIPFEDLRRFVTARHSVRNYDPSRTVERHLVEEIVTLASTTPSVCNRRSYRAHYFDNANDIADILALQNGNSGFGHIVPALIVVTERRSAFVGAGERNQRWVDGGLFAMSIVWFSHALGLSSCFLNWSQSNSATNSLRRIANIDHAEDVIVLIALGYGSTGHRVARSPKRSLRDTLVYH